MYESQLRELGLTNNEVNIYLSLLKQGTLSPSEIAEKLGLHRGYVYDSLKRMQEKDVIKPILKNNKKFFEAANPKSIAELLKSKLENFQKIVPNLMSLSKTIENKTKVEIHKDKKAYAFILKDLVSTLKKNDEIFMIGTYDKSLSGEVEQRYFEQYQIKINSKEIKKKIITKTGSEKIKDKNTQYKELNEEYIGKTAQIIYKNKVALLVRDEPACLILIENKEVADTYKKQFELLWGVAA
jgi:sugar-specific transcriptional regulator TrmB